MNFRSFACALLASHAMAAVEADRVVALPGQTTFDTYAVYSGYLDIADTTNSLHYMFVESQATPGTDPLIIWFNGGPGCSSMLGWAQEHGPWIMENGTDYFIENPYSWNLRANMLYIESPAGVGFSYCGSTEDCTFNDETAADQNLLAVLKWFELYPEFGGNDLYISGESYAGIYVPYLSKRIYDFNQANKDDQTVFKPNLIGFAVGNGCTNWTYDCNPAYVDMGFWHSLYSQELRSKMLAANCDYGGLGMPNMTPLCEAYFAQFFALTSKVNIYNIYGICWGTSINPAEGKISEQTGQMIEPQSIRDYVRWAGPSKEVRDKYDLDTDGGDLPPCTFGTPLMSYFDQQDVRDALHIRSDIGAWVMCTGPPNFMYTELPQGSQFVYEELHGKIRMMHYSGDVDGAVPTDGTQAWIDNLNWDIDQAWSKWTYENTSIPTNATVPYSNQTAGYSTVYVDDFTFITIHGAGHMVPEDKPLQAIQFLYNWIDKVDLSTPLNITFNTAKRAADAILQ